MPRINIVPKSRKPVVCDRCRTPIPVGSRYMWAKRRYGPRMVRCTKDECRFRASDLSSAKTAVIYDAIDDAADKTIWEAEDADAICAILEDVAIIAREVADEYDEALSAWPDGSQPDMEERRDACNDFAAELENWSWDGEAQNADEMLELVRAEAKEEAEQSGDPAPTENEIREEADERWGAELDSIRNDTVDLLSSFSA